MVRKGVDLSIVYRGMGKGEGVRWVGVGLTSPFYTQGGVRWRERGG